MVPPEQRLETRMILRADDSDLNFIQNGWFFDLEQTIRFRHARKVEKFQPRVQSKVNIPLPRAVPDGFMSQPCSSTPRTTPELSEAPHWLAMISRPNMAGSAPGARGRKRKR